MTRAYPKCQDIQVNQTRSKRIENIKILMTSNLKTQGGRMRSLSRKRI